MPFFENTGANIYAKSILPQCEKCGLKNGCKSPVMPPTGQGRRGVLVIAEAPGAVEDDRNEQLVGPAGQVLREILDEIGVDLDRDCWKTNSIVCRPANNATPTNEQIEYCRPNLTKTLQDFDPNVLVLLGGIAIRSVMQPIWGNDVGAMSRWVGWQIPNIASNRWICPTYHPSFIMRKRDEKAREYDVLKLWFKRHLQAAFDKTEKPYQSPPDYKKMVKVLYDTDQAAERIRRHIVEGGAVAFDYETNRLKPDADNARIISCAVCFRGQESIAYPWSGAAVDATRELLVSDLPKIGAMCKFEERWTRSILGVEVNNWKWDCVLSAHHLDCRQDITSVKFQAVVKLGVDNWSKGIEEYLESTDANGLNRIRELNLQDLLFYNGLDALYEYHLANVQKKEMMSESN